MPGYFIKINLGKASGAVSDHYIPYGLSPSYLNYKGYTSISSLCCHFGLSHFFTSFEIINKNCFNSIFMMTSAILNLITLYKNLLPRFTLIV